MTKEETTYSSPIEIFINDVKYSMEQAVLAAVNKCEIKVNKDELIKALTYDRQQYEEGYKNAMKQMPKPLTEEDYTELRDRFGEYVEFVVRDMISGKEERWK